MNAQARYVLAAAAGAAYAVASCLLMIRMPDSPLALAAVLGPMGGAAIVSLYLAGRRFVAALLAAGALALAAHAMNGGRITPQLLYLAQHAGVHLALGLWFGSTLLAGRTPLITSVARHLHGELPQAQVRYTRQVTLAWVVYFMTLTAASLLLFVAAPFSVWSLFANLLTPLALVAMFAGEYLLRYRLHPEFERVSMRAAIAAYRHRP